MTFIFPQFKKSKLFYFSELRDFNIFFHLQGELDMRSFGQWPLVGLDKQTRYKIQDTLFSKSVVDFTKSCKSKISRKCEFQPIKSLEITLTITLTINLRLTTFCEIDPRAPGGHDTTFIISTYTINKVKYNNYFITINHVCHGLEQREVIQTRWS